MIPIPIDPMLDPVIRRLFATEGNKDILLGFLNAVLDHIASPLAVSIELVPPRNPRSSKEDKETEVDVRARDADGRIFQIEVQLDPGGPLTKRMIYGASVLYASTINKGDSYAQLKPVISIWLLRDRLPHNNGPKNPVSVYRLRDDDGKILHDYPVIVVIELQNWTKNATFKEELELWFYFFVHGKELSLADELPPFLQKEVFVKAVDEIKRFNDSLARRLAYNSRMDKLSWRRSLEEEAEARRQQDEAQRAQDEAQRAQDKAQRAQDKAYRLETDAIRQETDVMRDEIKRQQLEMKARLESMFRVLVESGKSPEEAANLLGIDPQDYGTNS